jgi:hypothetical protein
VPQQPTVTASGVPGPASYGPASYGPASYGPASYGAAPYGAAAHGPFHGYPHGYPHGYAAPPPGYGYAYPFTPPAWPAGPRRPGVATAASVLGFVTGGLTMLFSFGFLIAVLAGEDDVVTQTLLLGALSAAGLITGAVRLLGRRSPTVLFGSSLASVAVLLLALLAAAVTIDRTSGLDGILMFVLFAMVLPVVTAVFAWLPVVRGWAADRPE